MTPSPALSNDPDRAIPRLLEDYGDVIYRLGLRLCDEPDFAEDLVQETFLRAYRSWARFERRSQPLTWLYTIATRACHRMQRRRAGQPRRIEPLGKLLASGSEWQGPATSSDPTPLDDAIRSEEVARLHRAISTLPAAFRLPLVLKELEGLSVRDVAEILGLREATVKTRLHRARLTLGAELTREDGPPPDGEATHTRRQCADLLTAKLEAMARGVDFPIEGEQICARCAPTLDALDRTCDIGADIPVEPLPKQIREAVERTFAEFERGR